MKNIILILLFCILSSCVSQQTAEEVLSNEGYYNIVVTGWDPFGCSEDDDLRSRFEADRTILDEHGNPSEIHVEGTICCGLLKACTVRH